MEPPYPSAALMLPAIDLSSSPNLDNHLDYKRREARWKQLVSNEHKKWCLCGSYLNHFLPRDKSLLKESCGEDDGRQEPEGADGGEKDGVEEGDFIRGLEEGGEEL